MVDWSDPCDSMPCGTSPLPLHGNLWFQPSEDMLSIGILEAVLTER